MQNRTQEIINSISAVALVIMLAVSMVAIGAKLVWRDGLQFFVNSESAYTQVVVQSGDTLWSIATNKVPNEDPRDVVAALRELNDLNSAEIFPGQVLTLEVQHPVEPLRMASKDLR